MQAFSLVKQARNPLQSIGEAGRRHGLTPAKHADEIVISAAAAQLNRLAIGARG